MRRNLWLKIVGILAVPLFTACGVPQTSTDANTSAFVDVKKQDRGDGYDQLDFNQLNWKTTMMTGDDSIVAFDNARKKLADMFQDYGGCRDHVAIDRLVRTSR